MTSKRRPEGNTVDTLPSPVGVTLKLQTRTGKDPIYSHNFDKSTAIGINGRMGL